MIGTKLLSLKSNRDELKRNIVLIQSCVEMPLQSDGGTEEAHSGTGRYCYIGQA